MKNKKGISLIVLVITIIVMIILAAAVIISLSNNGIIDKANEAVDKTNEAQVQQIAQLAWSDAYLEAREDGEITDEVLAEIKGKVVSALEENGIDTDNYAITVTKSGVEVYTFPQDWRASVTTIVNGVPIPKGFVASPYDGENTKNGGLVIYELNENETAIPTSEAYQTSLESRNQFVWIPVDDISNFKRQSFNGETLGEGLTVSTDNGEPYWEATPNIQITDVIQQTKTVSNPEYETCVDEYLENVEEDFWDWADYCIEEFGEDSKECADYVKAIEDSEEACKDYPKENIQITEVSVSQKTTEKTIDEITAMYASIEKYGGFYIARYEAGKDDSDNVSVTMGKYPYVIKWGNGQNDEAGGAVEAARNFYTSDTTNANYSKYGVVSTLTYSVQWDTTLQWWKKLDPNINLLDSTAYGNYTGHSITSSSQLNTGAKYNVSRKRL